MMIVALKYLTILFFDFNFMLVRRDQCIKADHFSNVHHRLHDFCRKFINEMQFLLFDRRNEVVAILPSHVDNYLSERNSGAEYDDVREQCGSTDDDRRSVDSDTVSVFGIIMACI